MIRIEQEKNCLLVEISGEFSLADFREFEAHALYRIRFQGALSLLLDLRLMQSYTIDVVWNELRFMRDHRQAFDRVAVLTEDQWLTWSGWIANLFVDADVAAFAEPDAAREWLGAEF